MQKEIQDEKVEKYQIYSTLSGHFCLNVMVVGNSFGFDNML